MDNILGFLNCIGGSTNWPCFSMKDMSGKIVIRSSNFSRHVSNMASKSRAATWEVSLEIMASVSPNIILAG